MKSIYLLVVSSCDDHEPTDHRFLFSVSMLATACSLIDDATVDDRAMEEIESRFDADDEKVEEEKLLVILLSNVLFSISCWDDLYICAKLAGDECRMGITGLWGSTTSSSSDIQ